MHKETVSHLALFGGAPAFEEKLHVGRPNIGDRERLMERLNAMLDRRWFSNDGPLVQELEQRLCDVTGAKHCLVMCNATVALEIAVRAAGLTGEVIVPSFTFIATAHALQWQQITPVFCDVAPGTHNIDPQRVEALITPRTTAIIGTHVWGAPCDVDALAEIAGRRRLRLMFDAAHAFGCSYKGRMIGNFGDAEVFSFHATKFLNAFEGGAVATNDDGLAEKIRLMRNFGFAGYDKVVYIGTNGKMNEASAAMALSGLECMDEIIAVNRKNHETYRRVLRALPGVSVFAYDDAEQCNYQYVALEVDEAQSGISRDRLLDMLWAENVMARRYFYPGCHRMEPYLSYFPHAGLLLPETEALSRRILVLPTGTSVGEDEIEKIGHLLAFAVNHAGEVNRRLEAQ